ncbi:hypothetical protein, partial [Halobiforma nitratireducens]
MLEVALTASGVEVPDRTAGQLLGTFVLLVVAAVALVVLYRKNRFAGLEGRAREHKEALLESLRTQTPATVRVPARADVADYREEVATALERAQARARGDADPDPDYTTLREATGSVLAALADATADSRVRRLFPDRLTAVLAALAVTIVTFGAPAVSTDGVVTVLESGDLSVGGGIGALGDATIALTDYGLEALSAFPFAGRVAELALAVGVLVGSVLYEFWFLSAALAALGWAFLYRLGEHVGEDRHERLYGRRELSLAVAKPIAAVYLAGVVPTALGTAAGAETVGAVTGLAFAALLSVYYLAAAGISAASRVAEHTNATLPIRYDEYTIGPLSVSIPRLERSRTESLGFDDPESAAVWSEVDGEGDDEGAPDLVLDSTTLAINEAFDVAYDPFEAATALEDRLDATDEPWRGPPTDWGLAAYLVCRRAFAATAAVLAPLPLVYLGSGVSSGAYLSVASSLVSGHVVGLLVPVALLAGIGYLAYLARDSYDDVRDAVTEALTRQSVRMAMFQRGLTVGAGLLSGTVLWAFSQSYLVTPIGAVVLGGLVYHGYAAADRATYRLDVFGRDGPARQSVLIQAYALEDADGTEHLVTQVGSDYRLSRDSATELVA